MRRGNWQTNVLAALAVTTGIVNEAAAGGKGGGARAPSAPHVSAPRMPAPRPMMAMPAPRVQAQKAPAQAMNRNAAKQVASVQRQALQQNAKQMQSLQRQASARAAMSRQARSRTGTYAGIAPRRGRNYGYRPGVRRYRGYSYGNRYAYNNQLSRAVVSRLRSTRMSLSRLDRDYQGHRVRAIRSIDRAIGQLSHRPSWGMGRNAFGVAGRRNLAGAGINPNRNRQRIPQAQSDARMRSAMSSLVGVNNQLSSQGYGPGYYRARVYVQQAHRELGIGLQIR